MRVLAVWTSAKIIKPNSQCFKLREFKYLELWACAVFLAGHKQLQTCAFPLHTQRHHHCGRIRTSWWLPWIHQVIEEDGSIFSYRKRASWLGCTYAKQSQFHKFFPSNNIATFVQAIKATRQAAAPLHSVRQGDVWKKDLLCPSLPRTWLQLVLFLVCWPTISITRAQYTPNLGLNVQPNGIQDLINGFVHCKNTSGKGGWIWPYLLLPLLHPCRPRHRPSSPVSSRRSGFACRMPLLFASFVGVALLDSKQPSPKVLLVGPQTANYPCCTNHGLCHCSLCLHCLLPWIHDNDSL